MGGIGKTGPQVSGRTKRSIENDKPKKTFDYKAINNSRHPNDPRRAGPAGTAGGASEARVLEASSSTNSFRNAFN